jgi:acyl carrier protein
MDDLELRLAAFFAAVLPELTEEEISRASAASVANWDSVATVTLIVVVKEESGVTIEIDDPAQFDSFQRIPKYLKTIGSRKQVIGDFA